MKIRQPNSSACNPAYYYCFLIDNVEVKAYVVLEIVTSSVGDRGTSSVGDKGTG